MPSRAGLPPAARTQTADPTEHEEIDGGETRDREVQRDGVERSAEEPWRVHGHHNNGQEHETKTEPGRPPAVPEDQKRESKPHLGHAQHPQHHFDVIGGHAGIEQHRHFVAMSLRAISATRP